MFKWLKKKKTAVQKNEVRQMALQALVLPEIDIAKVKEFAMNGWELGETHGLPHWQRVERNKYATGFHASVKI